MRGHLATRWMVSFATLAALHVGVACNADEWRGNTSDGALPPGNGASAEPEDGDDRSRAEAPADPGVRCSDGRCTSSVSGLDGVSFVTGVFTRTDETSKATALLRLEPPAVCVSGSATGWALVALGLSEDLRPGSEPALTDRPFDAAAHGITAVQFTLESPPSHGIQPSIATLSSNSDCGAKDCRGVEELTLTSGGADVSVRVTTRLTLPLIDFQHPNLALDPSRLLGLHFLVQDEARYDFCVRDVAFLEPAGGQVVPQF